MKAKYFIIGLAAALLAGMGATAQTAIHLATAGTLKDTSGIKTVTHLTLTGVIDTRDVKFMRDSMVVLAELDLSGATVVRYEGKNGTSSSSSSSVAYPANEMPQYSFCRNSTGKTTLISVKLPAGLTSIGEMAFSNCSGLKELTLPAGLTAIGSDAFYNCSGLEELTLPAGLTAIGSYAFQSCSGLKELTFPAGLTSIGTSAFYNCSGLEELTLPAGLTSIGSAAFSNCSGLEELTLPAGLTSIGNDAFYRCSGLKELTFPAGLTSIGDYAFENCSGLDSVTNLSLTPQHIENSVFDGVSIENITLTVPDSAVASYKSANVWKDFGSSSSSNGITGGGVLLSVKPSNAALGSVSGVLLSGLYPAGTAVSVTAAPASGYSFWGWTSGGATLSASATLSFTLTQDTIITASFGKSGSYKLAEAGTLKDISGIESVTHLTLTGAIDARDVKFMRDNMPFLTELDLSEAIVVAYEGEGGTYPWGYYSYPANEMPQHSFYGEANYTGKVTLTSVKLPAGLTAIGSYAFYRCSGLKELTFPAGLTAIGSSAFQSCSGLKELTFPAGLTSIGSDAFYRCSGLKELTFPAGLTSIGDYAFSGCSGLDSVTNLSLTPQHIENSVFDGVSIENIALTVPDSAVASYKSANVWKDFSSSSNGITGGGVLLSVKPSNAALGSVSGALLSGLYPAGTAVSVTAAPASGYSFWGWTSGGATLSAGATLSFTLTQDTVITASFGKSGSYKLAEAGTLKDMSGIESLTHLTLTGAIDARDVKFMRDNMPFLTELDLSEAIVVAYEGEGGTYSWGYYSYPANEMPQHSFYDEANYTGKVTLTSVKLPAGLTAIGSVAFYNCSGLEELTLPAGLTAIGNAAFSGCSGLSGSLTFPAGLTSIGSDAFYRCSGLKELTFPAGLTSIGSYAFQSCSGLDSVTNLSLTPQHIENSVFDGVSIENIALTVPDSAVASYKSANVWKDFGSSSSNGITGGGVLLSVKPSNAALGSVSGALLSGLYPAGTAVSVTAAPASGYSFWGWTSGGATLSASATLSFTLTQDTIITASFGKSGSYKLAEAGTLKDMSGIESVTHLTLTGAIDARDVKFMRNAMPFLTELDLSEAIVVAYEGEGGTYPWGYYSYPANEMPQHSFYDEANYTGKVTLTSVKLPAGLTAIGSYAFSNCSGLEELTFPAGLTAIGSAAFYGCSGLSGSLTFPAGLTSIGSDAFYRCSGLKELTFPAGLTSIGDYAFENCSGLDSVTNLSLTPQHIENSVFDGVNIENITLTVPDSAVASYKSANVWKDFGSSSSNGITGGGVLLSVKPSNAALGSVSGALLSGGLYPAGTVVSVTAAPASGYSFWGWTSGGATLSASATLSFTLTQDTVITASFGKTDSCILAKAGTLKDMSGIESVTHLTLTGLIDARDVKFMRDAMPFLTELDLSGVIVVAYEGEGGTSPQGYQSYPANEMPQYAFYNGSNGIAKAFLTSVKLPAGLTSIGERAFYSCRGLTAVTNLSLTPQDITNRNVFYNVSVGSVTLRVSAASLEAYKSAPVWKDFYLSGGATLRARVNNSEWGAVAGAAVGWWATGATVSLAATPAQGYEFDSWTSGGETLAASASLSFTIAQDTVITANFKPTGNVDVYTVTFVANGGSGVDPIAVAAGDRIAKPADPALGGYTFDGWYGNAELTGSAWSFETGTVTADTALYARWAKITCTVTFETGGGSSVEPLTVDPGAHIAKPANPTRTGYTFDGWYRDAALSGSEWNFAGDAVSASITLYAMWAPIIYIVSFSVDGESSVKQQQVAYGGKIAEPADPTTTRTGYTFGGWYSDAAFAGSAWDFAGDAVTATTTLYAGWAKIIYTATFETGDGSSVSPQPVAYGNKIDKPADPSRTGYGFDKWYKDEALTTAWDFAADTVTANTTLYAAWQIKRYAVTFVSNGGSSVGGQTIDSLGKVAEPDDPARTGYNFVGWYKDDETFEDKWDFDADKVTANTTLYAAWQIKRYTVTFVSNGGSNVDGQTIDSLGTVNEANAHSARVGYNFVGWYKDAALTAAWDFAADKVTADATLYAKWTEIVYTVTFETGDGSSVDPQPVAYGNKIVKPADDPTRDGYTFAGWFKDAAFTGAWNFTTDVVTADTTLYARWIDKGATTYAVTFISNGDTVSSQLVEENDKVAQLTPPNRVGYTFGGWYSDAAFAGSAWDFAGNVVTADTTLYARWTEIIYTVTFETGGGSSVSPQTVAHGGKIVKPADDPSRDGYIFAGWYSDAAFAGSAWDFAADKVTSDTTLYARWIGKDAAIYTVTFVSNGDTVSSQPVEENGKVAPFTPPTRDGYTFAGWYSDAAFAGSAWDFAGSVVTADTTLYARWIGKDAAIYTVTFISNGDTVSSQPVAQGDTVVKPADPTRTGYTFEGWYSDEAFAGSAWDFATNVVTSDATLYARWNALPPTGVKSQTLGVARVYPNPTSGTITVESDGAEVWLYSLSGVLLERTSGNRINLSGYPAGVYLLRTGSKAAKVVKQ